MKKETLIKEATNIIRRNFGNETAKLYQDFYAGQTPENIVLSLKLLLKDFLGPKGATSQLNSLRAKIKRGKSEIKT